MSIYGAMFSGVSGLSSQSQALGMIADNISNVNTIGYKGSVAQFSTLVTQSPTRTAFSPGGVISKPAAQIDRQGLLQASVSKTDLAIAGSGFFVVNEAANPGAGNEYFFTRAGSFNPDENGDFVNAAGYYLQGWPLGTGGTLPANTTVLSGVQTVNVANLTGTASPTQNLSLGLNLPSTDAVAATHAATVQVFDSLGNAHDIQITFTKAATNDWDITVGDPVLASTGVVSGTTTVAVRNITFNGDGTPATITFPPIAVTGWTTGANNSGATMSAVNAVYQKICWATGSPSPMTVRSRATPARSTCPTASPSSPGNSRSVRSTKMACVLAAMPASASISRALSLHCSTTARR